LPGLESFRAWFLWGLLFERVDMLLPIIAVLLLLLVLLACLFLFLFFVYAITKG